MPAANVAGVHAVLDELEPLLLSEDDDLLADEDELDELLLWEGELDVSVWLDALEEELKLDASVGLEEFDVDLSPVLETEAMELACASEFDDGVADIDVGTDPVVCELTLVAVLEVPPLTPVCATLPVAVLDE